MLDSFASPEFHSYGNSWRHVTTIVIMSSSTLFNSPTHSFGPVDYMDMLVSCIVRIIHLLVEYFGQKKQNMLFGVLQPLFLLQDITVEVNNSDLYFKRRHRSFPTYWK